MTIAVNLGRKATKQTNILLMFSRDWANTSISGKSVSSLYYDRAQTIHILVQVSYVLLLTGKKQHLPLTGKICLLLLTVCILDTLLYSSTQCRTR